jgi:hypothetical protein
MFRLWKGAIIRPYIYISETYKSYGYIIFLFTFLKQTAWWWLPFTAETRSYCLFAIINSCVLTYCILTVVGKKKTSTLLSLREDFVMFIGQVSFILYTLDVSVLVKDFPSVFMPENISKSSKRSHVYWPSKLHMAHTNCLCSSEGFSVSFHAGKH